MSEKITSDSNTIEEISSITPQREASEKYADLSSQLFNEAGVAISSPNISDQLMQLKELQNRANILLESLKKEEKKTWNTLYSEGLNSAQRLRKNLLGGDTTQDEKVDSGSHPVTNYFVPIEKKELPNTLSDEDIKNVENILLLSAYYNEYSERVDSHYAHEDIIDAYMNDSWDTEFGFYPTDDVYEYDGVLSPEGTPEKMVAEIFGLDIINYNEDREVRVELILDVAQRLSGKSLTRFCELFQENYEIIEKAIVALSPGHVPSVKTPYGQSYYEDNGDDENDEDEPSIYTYFSCPTSIGELDAATMEEMRLKLSDLIPRITQIAVQRGEREPTRKLIELMGSKINDKSVSDLLYFEEFTKEERLLCAAEIINVYGFMPGINFIKKGVASKETSDSVKKELNWAFNQLQGEEDEVEIIQELSDVYKRVNFHEYALNSMELTSNEVILISQQIKEFAEKSGISQSEVVIIDIGAGTGRHSLALTEMGQKNVIAFEFEHQHTSKIIEQANEKSLDLITIEGDWSMLHQILNKVGAGKCEIAVVLNRTIMHNSSPDAMLHWWDELNQILPQGVEGVNSRVIIDIPDIEEGEYLEKTQKIRQSLTKCGVKETATMHLFDGPNDELKFNRLALTEEQFRTYAELFGFRVVEKTSKVLGDNGEIKNDYYVLEKDPTITIEDKYVYISDFRKKLESIGVVGLGIDWNMEIATWGVRLKDAVERGLTTARHWLEEEKEEAKRKSGLSL